ncbi:PREDICTED: tRNA (adenine(58)-N(1))-methyltransferase non-catalytic subunit TRM6 [Eufriesea mexicana]|uniref:tRNA (adenine(58)-N(1))-methyltransferase non-catalytic subunit TRM6 n=1 Tax=Eufriesea mexicana TaxID=516756 RepID=UPI00083C0ABF|nr:PREDICTED: tRNA (adenine(58)-N(1))-methyltransferase non-catalytic subunit TRM6 [Eufriesea mexicana]
MCENENDLITIGKFVIVKRLNFKKIYKVAVNGTLMLGKNLIQMHEIIGKRFWTTFEMVPIKEGKRTYSLREVLETETLNDLLNELPSGNDNRSIIDDGTSQKLSKEEILQLQESGKSGKEIVGSLIKNNKSFLDRTEYSQEKYLKKKEQKYLRYLTICKPSISSLHDVYFKLDHTKIGNLRMDSLSQLLSYSDIQSEGLYILYDNGSQGLPAAAMLNRIGSNTTGCLINLHPGNVPQVVLINAMNFSKEQSERLLNVNIYSFLRLYYQGEGAVLNNISKKTLNNCTIKQNESKSDGENHINNEILEIKEIDIREQNLDVNVNDSNETLKHSTDSSLKRKLNECNEYEFTEVIPAKKPKWLLETQRAVELVKNTKARGLAIVAKEHPLNIVNALLPFLGPSRPFVIYHIYREPLQETYMMLKQKQNVINLRLFTNFLRSYQVLPDRTHPDILTSDTGGYLLTGYLIQ